MSPHQHQILCRSYLDLQHLRMAVDARLRSYDALPDNVLKILQSYYRRLKSNEKELLNDFKELLSEHPIWQWCQSVKGLGVVASLTFLGFIDPIKATSAGKAWKYLGFAPDSNLHKGKRANFNPEAKGRFWLLTRNVIMKRDEYYYPLYLNKKGYYEERMGVYIKNPELCPDYESCIRRITNKARRLDRKPKTLPCKLHIDNRAKRWLAKLLISHALEIMRNHIGLPFPQHRNYIPPKPH